MLNRIREVFFTGTITLLITASFLVAVPASAQFKPATYPAIETYVGFSANNNEYGTDRHNSFGFQLTGGYNPHRNIRLIGDFAAQYHGTDIGWTVNDHKATLREYQFLVGPEFAIRTRSRATPFLRSMVGFAYRNYAIPSNEWEYNPESGWTPVNFSLASDLGFAAAFGGGVDVDIHPNLAFRVVQFDYVRTHLSRNSLNWEPVQGQLPIVTGWQNNYRFSCGIVLKLGERGGRRK